MYERIRDIEYDRWQKIGGCFNYMHYDTSLYGAVWRSFTWIRPSPEIPVCVSRTAPGQTFDEIITNLQAHGASQYIISSERYTCPRQDSNFVCVGVILWSLEPDCNNQILAYEVAATLSATLESKTTLQRDSVPCFFLYSDENRGFFKGHFS